MCDTSTPRGEVETVQKGDIEFNEVIEEPKRA